MSVPAGPISPIRSRISSVSVASRPASRSSSRSIVCGPRSALVTPGWAIANAIDERTLLPAIGAPDAGAGGVANQERSLRPELRRQCDRVRIQPRRSRGRSWWPHPAESGCLARGAGRRRDCPVFVDPAARRTSPETSVSTRPLAASVPAPRRGSGEEQVSLCAAGESRSRMLEGIGCRCDRGSRRAGE
jgi:hypothetical protein